jgi:leucyl-tRNA synthetase
MFIGPWDQGGEWNDHGIKGMHRWFNRIWPIVIDKYEPKAQDADKIKELLHITHKTIKRVHEDCERFHFNTMLAALMEFTNYLGKAREDGAVSREAFAEATRTLMLLLAPTAPHLAEELWERTGNPYSIHNQPFPQWDEKLAAEDEFTLVIQVNGKLRDKVNVPAAISENEVKQLALGRDKIKESIKSAQIRKVIYVPRKLVNIVAT